MPDTEKQEWRERIADLEAERDRLEQLRHDAVTAHRALETAFDAMEAERDRLADALAEADDLLSRTWDDGLTRDERIRKAASIIRAALAETERTP